MTLSKLLCLSDPQLPHPLKGENIHILVRIILKIQKGKRQEVPETLQDTGVQTMAFFALRSFVHSEEIY